MVVSNVCLRSIHNCNDQQSHEKYGLTPFPCDSLGGAITDVSS
jgi:hypothetical protein